MPDRDKPTQDQPGPPEGPEGPAGFALRLSEPPPAPIPDAPPREPADRHTLLRIGKIVIQIAVLCGIAWVVWHELKAINLRTAGKRLHDAHHGWVAAAAGAAVIALSMMGLYDVLAFPSTPTLRRRSRWFMGVLIFSWTNFLTLGPIGGPALRLFFYRRRGLETPDIVRGMVRIYAGTFAGISSWLVAAILPVGDTPWSSVYRATTALLAGPVLGVLMGRMASRFKSVSGADLSDWRAAALGLLGATDWGIAISVFVFCGWATEHWGPNSLSVSGMMRTMTVGHAVGFVSMIPGGLGSADAVWLKMLRAFGADPDGATAHILLFRIVYYLMPWTASLLVLYGRFSGVSEPALRWQRRLLAVAVSVNAALLLVGAAWPAVEPRLHRLQDVVPLDSVEASHAVGVICAAVMLFLVRGILRGYRVAFVVTGVALVASSVAHLIKGGDLEETLVSMLLLTLLIGSRNGFTRRGRVPIGWELALGATFGTLMFFLLVGLAAFPHRLEGNSVYEAYQNAMKHPSAVRVVHGAELIAVVGLIFVLRQATFPRTVAVRPGDADIDRAIDIIRRLAPHAAGLTVAAGDKGIWFWSPDKEPQGLVLYQRRHRKLVVFSDPVVEEEHADDLLEDFHAFARDEDLDVVFYQASTDWTERLRSFRYTFFKLGEEAVVNLAKVAASPHEVAGQPEALERIESRGVRFEVLSPPFDAKLLAEARTVSDAWLAARGAPEMQFALGHFAPEYIERFPLAVARDGEDRLIAFMNILATAPGSEQSSAGEAAYDLLRYEQGVSGLGEYMVQKLVVWAAGQRYAAVNLGLSPLYDVGEYQRASIPERFARLMFERGERIYGYRGTHEFKDAFGPLWQARYMGYQRPWDWSSAVLSTTSLIWGRTPRDRRHIERARAGR